VGRTADAAGRDAAGGARTPSLAPRLEEGGLTVQARVGRRRRIAPIPTGWEGLDGAGLLRLLPRAELQPRTYQRPTGKWGRCSRAVLSVAPRVGGSTWWLG
jgi:hypothetical protein